jgi:hypothetical protein
MFDLNFKKSVKNSFTHVKEDVSDLRDETHAFKDSVDEWITFLEGERRELRQRVLEQEQRLLELESAIITKLRRN